MVRVVERITSPLTDNESKQLINNEDALTVISRVCWSVTEYLSRGEEREEEVNCCLLLFFFYFVC